MTTARKSTARIRSPKRKTAGLFSGYSTTKRPLGGYAALVGLFSAGLASAFAALKQKSEHSPELSPSDLLLFGIATHKLSRIAAKDLVTSPFRAPFVKFKKSAGAGEVEEEARGQGLREAVGDLITCPYCMAPWIAAVLVFASGRAPRSTRIVSAIFTITAGSDFLNRLYSRAKG